VSMSVWGCIWSHEGRGNEGLTMSSRRLVRGTWVSDWGAAHRISRPSDTGFCSRSGCISDTPVIRGLQSHEQGRHWRLTAGKSWVGIRVGGIGRG
jgi:hypothetical protein